MRGRKSSRYALRAEGAAFMSKPGATPQAPSKSESTSAESAIHFGQQFESTGQLNRAFSARFRGDLNSWGDAPGSPRRIRPVAD